VFIFGFLLLAAYARYLSAYLFIKRTAAHGYAETVFGVAFIGIVMVIINHWTHLIFYIDAEGFYTRGPFFWLTQAVSAVMLMVSAVIIFVRRKVIAYDVPLFITAYALIPSVFLLVQIFFYGITFLNIGGMFSCLLIYSVFFNRQTLQMQDLALELRERDIELVQSQIRPHFVSNALLAIRDLCDTDPQAAGEAIDEFSSYLRYNMNVMGTKELVPFTQELRHAEMYLSLEKRRFGDVVNWEFDIKTNDFSLPALTLQPLVENALRHGILKKAQGGLVRVTAEWENSHAIVTVSDNGIGFNSAYHNDGRNHIGLENVQRRLDMRLGGVLKIESIPGEGTTVTIVVPFLPSALS
jgi:signal transduction histidine kinase